MSKIYTDLNTVLTPYATAIKKNASDITSLNGSLETLENDVLTHPIKFALLNCISDMVCHDEFEGDTHYHALFRALYGADKVEFGEIYAGSITANNNGFSYTKQTTNSNRMVTSPVAYIAEEGDEYEMYLPDGYKGIIGFITTDTDVSDVDFTLASSGSNKTFFTGACTVTASSWTTKHVTATCPSGGNLVYFYLSKQNEGRITQDDIDTLKTSILITKKSA